MTCRHSKGDPNCSSTPDGYAALRVEEERKESRRTERLKEEAEVYARTPDADKYEIVDVAAIGPHLILKVKYPNCSKCSYEGNKVMVFFNTSTIDALKWKRIDPHFRDPNIKLSPGHAPAPAARFPASKEGWVDALVFAEGKKK